MSARLRRPAHLRGEAWEEVFLIKLGYRPASAWRRWFVCREDGWFSVIYDGRSELVGLTCFDRLAGARRFAEQADGFIDHTRPLEEQRDLGLVLHRLALHISGCRPALRLVEGGR